jgi:hypothetical protein
LITRNQIDPWASIQKDLKRLQSEEPAEMQEFGERIPCPDESCLGTLGENGLCRLCGMGPVVSREQEPASRASQDEPESSKEAELKEDEEAKEEEEQRVCCSDESCVGTVDERGYCRICGLKWKEDGYLEGESLVYKEDSLE